MKRNTKTTNSKLTSSQAAALARITADPTCATLRSVDRRVINNLVKLGHLHADIVKLSILPESEGPCAAVVVTDAQREARAPKAEAPKAPCLCGCGQLPAGRRSAFAQGHDMKLRSAVVQAARIEEVVEVTPAQAAWVKAAHWFNKALAAFVVERA